MPTTANVILAVQSGPAYAGSGFTNTTASNGAAYCYKYSDGSGTTNGDVMCTGRVPVDIVVQLHGDPNFRISSITFPVDPHRQHSWQETQSTATTATIHNINNMAQTADYKVNVFDTAANCTVPCDPHIINQ